ncbi:hypothetical protein [Planktomarina temperata]|uniref:hypothetical protein n=2 Tax=Planktomarina temperata TaxID=1284658 RepID=UPI003C77D056
MRRGLVGNIYVIKTIYLICVHDLMTDLRPDLADDEIDLRELFAVLCKRSGKPIGQPDRLHFHQTVMRLLEIQFFTRSRRNLTNPLGTLIILPMAIAPMVLAVVFKTQTGAAFIAFWGFVALFAVAYRWALRRGGQAANRTSRKFEQS